MTRGHTLWRSLGGAKLLLPLVILTIGHTAWKGYRFGDSNLTIHVPLVKNYADPRLYPGDPMVATGSRHPSFFFPAIAVVVRALDHLEVQYFVLFLVAKLLGLWARWSLATLVFSDRNVALLFVIIALGETVSLNQEPLHAPRLTHGEFACSLLMCAIVLYLRDRKWAAYLLTGLSFNIHSLFASSVFAMFAADSALSVRELRVRSIARWWGTFFLLALPTLIWILQVREPLDPKWVELLRVRSEGHSFPLSWRAEKYTSFLALLALAGLGLRSGARPDLQRKLLRFAGVVGVFCLAGVALTEWHPTKIALQGQFTRATRILTEFALLYVARLMVDCWGRGLVAKTAAAMAFLAVFFPATYVQLLLLAIAILLVLRAKDLPRVPVLIAAVTLVLASIYPPGEVPPQLGIGQLRSSVNQFLQLQVLLCVALFVLWQLSNALPWRRIAATVISGVLLLYAVPAQYRSVMERLKATSWVRVQIWARENTPRTAAFITPPERSGFRVFSERPVIGEWKDGTQLFFSDRFGFEWSLRMQDLGYPNFKALQEKQLLDIAARYGARYLVFPAERTLGFQQLFATDEYIVYGLERIGVSP